MQRERSADQRKSSGKTKGRRNFGVDHSVAVAIFVQRRISYEKADPVKIPDAETFVAFFLHNFARRSILFILF